MVGGLRVRNPRAPRRNAAPSQDMVDPHRRTVTGDRVAEARAHLIERVGINIGQHPAGMRLWLRVKVAANQQGAMHRPRNRQQLPALRRARGGEIFALGGKFGRRLQEPVAKLAGEQMHRDDRQIAARRSNDGRDGLARSPGRAGAALTKYGGSGGGMRSGVRHCQKSGIAAKGVGC